MSSDVMELDAEIVEGRVHAAVAQLLKNDAYLFVVGSSERSITHKLGAYLQEQFREWNVDCEYNRYEQIPKRLHVGERQTPGDGTRAAVTVYPDVIVHCRGTDQNLVVIEAKKQGEDTSFDADKLRSYFEEFNYRFAYALELPMGPSVSSADPAEMLHLTWQRS